MEQKPYTQYECASGEVGNGHSGLYTGAHPSNTTAMCDCGQPLVEVVPDGYRYKVVFETINPHQAAAMEAQYGRSIWARLNGAGWDSLNWMPPIMSENGSPNVLRDQYKRLLAWSEGHEQPIRNVKFFKTQTSE